MVEYFGKSSLQKKFKHYFHQLKDESIKDIIEAGKLIHLDPEEVIIKQGQNTKDVYFLLFGRITVLIENRYGEKMTLNEISKGEFFGEMSLLTGEPRTATVITTKESTLLKVDGEEFEKLLDKHPSILKYLNTQLINRLRRAHLAKNETSFQNVCFVQLEEKNTTSDFFKLLTKKLSQYPNIFIVTKEVIYHSGVFSSQDDEGAKKYKLTNWVNDLGLQYDYVVFLCDATDLGWSELCLRQADRIMLLGSKHLSTDLTKLENDIFIKKNIAAKIEKNIIINWAENEVISGTARILENRNIKNIFHIASEKEINKVIRYIQGNAIKLVFGGGGAKGFAHIGVYKAMLELGIPVDFIGGTSVGAIIASGIACGWSYEKVKSTVYYALVAKNPLNDYHFPFVSLLKGKKLEDMLYKVLGDRQIEDLPISFYAVASNFTKSEIEILNRGVLNFAVRASISLPAILPPVVKDNSLLVDGGLIDNLPFDYMNSIAQGPTIGVDLSITKKRRIGYDKIPNSSTLFKQKTFGKKKYKVPSISQIIMSTMTLASEEKRRNNEKKFDVYIKPDLSKYGFLKWKNFDAILQCGYETAFPILKEWKEKGMHSFKEAKSAGDTSPSYNTVTSRIK